MPLGHISFSYPKAVILYTHVNQVIVLVIRVEHHHEIVRVNRCHEIIRLSHVLCRSEKPSIGCFIIRVLLVHGVGPVGPRDHKATLGLPRIYNHIISP